MLDLSLLTLTFHGLQRGRVARSAFPTFGSCGNNGACWLAHALEGKGVYVSSGSACASNKPHTSATLEAIGLPRAYLDNTIRISLSEMTTEEDILQASTALHELIPFLRKYTRH